MDIWTPTWTIFKGTMLDTLGTLAERQQRAYNAIKSCRHRPNQSLSELLLYLRVQWEEVGDTNPTRHAHEYMSALSDSIKRDLWLLPQIQRSTVSQLEELANSVHRRLGRDRTTGPDTPRATLTSRPTQRLSNGPSDTKRVRMSQDGPNPYPPRHDNVQNDRPKRDLSEIECWNCFERGHRANTCPNPKVDRGDHAGKGPGREA